jgi:cytochrome P450
LVAAEEAGDRLSAREIVITCNLLLIAGNLTTTDLIGNGVLALLRHPDQLANLCAHPELVPHAVEEMLRYDPPVVQVARFPLEPLEIGGREVHAGQTMTCSLLAAGHDPALHSDPHRFDIERADTTHLAFGGGAHFCLGTPLARAEAQIAIATLFERFPSLQLDPAACRRAQARTGLQRTGSALGARRPISASPLSATNLIDRPSTINHLSFWRLSRIALRAAFLIKGRSATNRGEGPLWGQSFAFGDRSSGGRVCPDSRRSWRPHKS